MNFNITEIKTQSKKIMAETIPKQTGVAAVFVLISVLFSYLLFSLSGYNADGVYEKLMTYYSGGHIEEAAQYLMSIQPTSFQNMASALLMVAFLIVEAGLHIFTLNSVRKTEPCYGNLLDGFSRPFGILFITITKALIISFASLLLVFPGVLLFYSYRMSLYILIDNPGLSPFECLRRSRRMMKGHKRELFSLDMSFIFWYLISFLSFIGPVSQIISTPYRYNSYVIFYDNIKGEPESE